MMNVDDLYQYAEDHNIQVDDVKTGKDSLCLRFRGRECIAIDMKLLRTAAELKRAVAHEIGHCATGSFYNVHSKFEVVTQRERRAAVWAYKKLVTEDELHEAVRQGNTEMWQLAEYFDIPQEYMAKIVCFYEGIE